MLFPAVIDPPQYLTLPLLLCWNIRWKRYLRPFMLQRELSLTQTLLDSWSSRCCPDDFNEDTRLVGYYAFRTDTYFWRVAGLHCLHLQGCTSFFIQYMAIFSDSDEVYCIWVVIINIFSYTKLGRKDPGYTQNIPEWLQNELQNEFIARKQYEQDMKLTFK